MDDKLKNLINEARKGGFNLKEYMTRSEGPQLFSTVINDILIRAAQPEVGDTWSRIYDQLSINRRDISFPSIYGANPDLVPELSEFKFVDNTLTSITVTPQKFGMRLGFSKEMLEDNEVDLISWKARNVGIATRELKRQEAMKAISFFSTGPAKSTGAIGLRNHGPFYPALGYTNFISATAASWEERIGRAINALKTQTITIGDSTIQFPVNANFILANPTHMPAISKVLNSTITVVANGLGVAGAAAGSGTNVAGSNIFRGMLPVQIYDPTIVTGQAFVGEAGRGALVMVNRSPLQVDEMDNLAFDANEMRTRERYLPAVIAERFICDIQITG